MIKSNKAGRGDKGIVSLVTGKTGIDSSIVDAIRKKYGRVKINFVREREMLKTDDGLANLLRLCGKHGAVFAIEDGIANKSLNSAAEKTEVPFGFIYKNNQDKWEGIFLEPSKKVGAISTN